MIPGNMRSRTFPAGSGMHQQIFRLRDKAIFRKYCYALSVEALFRFFSMSFAIMTSERSIADSLHSHGIYPVSFPLLPTSRKSMYYSSFSLRVTYPVSEIGVLVHGNDFPAQLPVKSVFPGSSRRLEQVQVLHYLVLGKALSPSVVAAFPVASGRGFLSFQPAAAEQAAFHAFTSHRSR
jgi:hypothetical protein